MAELLRLANDPPGRPRTPQTGGWLTHRLRCHGRSGVQLRAHCRCGRRHPGRAPGHRLVGLAGLAAGAVLDGCDNSQAHGEGDRDRAARDLGRAAGRAGRARPHVRRPGHCHLAARWRPARPSACREGARPSGVDPDNCRRQSSAVCVRVVRRRRHCRSCPISSALTLCPRSSSAWPALRLRGDVSMTTRAWSTEVASQARSTRRRRSRSSSARAWPKPQAEQAEARPDVRRPGH